MPLSNEEIFEYFGTYSEERYPIIEVIPDKLWMHKVRNGHVNLAVKFFGDGRAKWISLLDSKLPSIPKGTNPNQSVESLKAIRDACQFALETYYNEAKD